jgi:acetyl/propionyl-CoA carboxylase alpha subunit
VRLDAGVHEGSEVPLHYDPLLAKLIVWGGDRRAAIERMRRALDEFSVAGVRTTLPFHRAVMRHPDFIAGRLSTAFVERALGEGSLAPVSRDRARAAAVAVALRARERPPEAPPPVSAPSRWALASRPGALPR